MKKILYEISWECCNKVGGIHTVISSKASHIEKNFDKYYIIGAFPAGNTIEFAEEEIPNEYITTFQKLKEKGIILHFGRWLIRGYPQVILVEYLNYSKNINKIKTILWEKYSIDSLNSSWYDYDEVILWSWCCGVAIEELSKIPDYKYYVHSHEWMSSASILYLKTLPNKSIYNCVFTTHATMLGRALSGNGQNIYNEQIKDPDKKSYEIGVNTKHQTEKALAHNADCFTTVSDITSEESNSFYGKPADIILYNGFSNKFIKNYEDLNQDFIKSRNQTNEFLKAYFHSTSKIDTDKTNLFFTSGRNEFRNKGVDIIIKSLGILNEKLKNKNFNENIVCLFLIPIGDYEKDEIILESMNLFNKNVESKTLSPYTPLSTHKVPLDNEIIRAFLNSGLQNKKDDKVKVILIPSYLNGQDGFLNRPYYDIIVGTDLSIFPSFYEPWGYTPLESISYAVPTITSDLAGFGRYVKKCCYKESIKILKRETKSYDEQINDLCNFIENFIDYDQKKITLLKQEAKDTAKHFDWEIFIENYLKAYKFAEENNSNQK